MKKLHLLTIPVAGLLLTSAAHSQVITVNDLRYNVTNADVVTIAGSPSSGTLNFISGSAPGSAVGTTPVSLVSSISGLDLDGIGGLNDSINFTWNVATSTGTTQATTAGWGVNGVNISANGQTFTMSLSSVSLSAGTLGSVAFDGFSQMGVRLNGVPVGAATFLGNVNGTAFSFNSSNSTGNIANVSFALSSTATLTAGPGSSGGNVRALNSDLQFTYTPVPEPSTTLLVLVGGLGAMGFVRRKRK